MLAPYSRAFRAMYSRSAISRGPSPNLRGWERDPPLTLAPEYIYAVIYFIALYVASPITPAPRNIHSRQDHPKVPTDESCKPNTNYEHKRLPERKNPNNTSENAINPQNSKKKNRKKYIYKNNSAIIQPDCKVINVIAAEKAIETRKQNKAPFAPSAKKRMTQSKTQHESTVGRMTIVTMK